MMRRGLRNAFGYSSNTDSSAVGSSDENSTKIQDNMNRLFIFVRTNKTFPTSEQGQKLVNWWNKFSEDEEKKGRIFKDNDNLKSQYNVLSSMIDWVKNMEKTKEFVQHFGRVPNQSGKLNEKKLAIWIHNQKIAYDEILKAEQHPISQLDAKNYWETFLQDIENEKHNTTKMGKQYTR
eukprot:402785-Pleurochrysis_carterae.AAC.2